MIVIPVKKNDCHSRENGNLLSYSEKQQPTGKQKKDKTLATDNTDKNVFVVNRCIPIKF